MLIVSTAWHGGHGKQSPPCITRRSEALFLGGKNGRFWGKSGGETWPLGDKFRYFGDEIESLLIIFRYFLDEFESLFGGGQTMDADDVKDYTEVVTVRVTKAQLARLKVHAENAGKSQSEVLRGWIENADLIPEIPDEVIANLRRYQGRRAPQLIKDTLQRRLACFGWWV